MPAPNDAYALRHKHCPGCDIFFNVHGLGPEEPITEAAPGVYYARCLHCEVRWHVHRPGTPERERAEAEVAKRPVDQPDLVAAWSHGVLRLTLAGQDYEVRRPADLIPGSDIVGHPLATVAHVLTAWTPGSRPGKLDRNRAAHATLLARVRDRGWQVADKAACHHADFAWAEQSVVVVGADEDQVLALAREFNQPAVLRWASGLMVVLSTTTREPLTTGEPVTVTRLQQRPCPMTGQPRSEVCRNPGGPWTSRSMQYARDWNDRRTCLLAALGCDICHGSPAEGPMGKPVDSGTLYDRQTVPSRYGIGRRRKTSRRPRKV
ncbi:DUF3293 domain-containing protein [Sphaerisporangium perillae]|uniref:DUF3293 domain-containing protein n=1 Tax=Sphaerisporangium perillae TaxID=2935860 RepID=UPI002010B41E|nr:DUF3293 domain-containing protein [Sphaerisporangium perillae]